MGEDSEEKRLKGFLGIRSAETELITEESDQLKLFNVKMIKSHFLKRITVPALDYNQPF